MIGQIWWDMWLRRRGSQILRGRIVYLTRMTDAEFEKLVEEGIAGIPQVFLKLVNNVAIVIKKEPTVVQLRKMHIGSVHTLLGLYEGIPQTRREQYGVGGALPDRITIFRRPIEEATGGDFEQIKELVAETVWHEIAHYFGMDEGKVRRSEADRKRKRSAGGQE